MKVSNLVRFTVISMVLLVLAVGVVGAQDDLVVLRTGINMVGGDFLTIDQALSEVNAENQIITEMFGGLTRHHDLTGELVTMMADSYEVTEDGLVYTFNIHPEVPWVHYNEETGAVEQVLDDSGNPRFVTAQDFHYGALRSMDPATASTYGYLPAGFIVNGAEFNAGEAAAEDVGIRVVDDYTLEITAPESIAFAPFIYGLWMMNAQPQWAIEAGGDSWTEPEFHQSYGPWALKEWDHSGTLVLIKNPLWPGLSDLPVPTIDEVVYYRLDPAQQFTEYLAGNLDAIDVPTGEIDRIRADAALNAEMVNSARSCTYYLGFDNLEAPMDNVHLRRALSLSIDREAIVTNVTKRGEVAAAWISRPGMVAAPSPETHADLGISFNPEEAQAELALALTDLGLASAADLPPLTAAYGDSADHGAIMQAIQQMWADNLGLNIQLVPMDSTTYFSTVSENAPMIYRSGWCADYPDASNFTYDLFLSTSGQNDPGYNNAEFDRLVTQARLESDTEVRRDLYAQAEDIFVNQDAGVAPIYWYVYTHLIKPHVEYSVSVNGRHHYERWSVN